ncbi:MAG: hypothetical protein IJT16_14485 [Lachnospiraceae bacterium]|nr:hypothetical protein [Lachnospiraceae bacterium]
MKKRILTEFAAGVLAGFVLVGCVAGGTGTGAISQAPAENEVSAKEAKETGTSPETLEESGEKTNESSGSGYHPLEHDYPENLLLFLAKEDGKDKAYPEDEIAAFYVNVDYGLQSQPLQAFTEEGIVEEFKAAIAGIQVTGPADEAGMTDSDTHYRAVDKNNETLFYFSTQNGRLSGMYSLYSLEGLDKLESIEGIMYAEDYERYYNEHGEFPDQ